MQAQLRIASNSVDAERKKPFGVIIPYYPHDWISGNQTPNGSEWLNPVVWSTDAIVHQSFGKYLKHYNLLQLFINLSARINHD